MHIKDVVLKKFYWMPEPDFGGADFKHPKKVQATSISGEHVEYKNADGSHQMIWATWLFPTRAALRRAAR